METEFYIELRKKAEELHPSDEKQKNDFVEGFVTKVANVLKDLQDKAYVDKSLGDSFFTRGMAQATGKALVGGVMATGFNTLMGAINVVKAHAMYNKFLQALDEAVKSNSVLRAADKSKVLNFGNTIFKFAPNVATDANVLETVLSNAVHGNSLDPMTIRMLTELEGRYKDSKGDSNFNPKNWI